MTWREAQEVLLRHRRDPLGEPDAETQAALAMVEQSPAHRAWFDNHCAFQDAVRVKLRQMEVPAGLAERILVREKVIPIVRRRHLPRWAWAAAAMVMIGLGLFLARPEPGEQFANFRSRMVRAALREYRMDIVTNDLTQVRGFMASRGAPADFKVPSGLSRLALTGGGLLRWRNHPVSMVCYDRGNQQMLYLFIIEGSAARNAPSSQPRIEKVNKLLTASWSEDGKTYLLAGSEEPDFPRKYLY